jgi:hypothetical protein
VVKRLLAQEIACSEPSVARTDDNSGGTFDGSASQATSTVTLVGLVRASNTAERF